MEFKHFMPLDELKLPTVVLTPSVLFAAIVLFAASAWAECGGQVLVQKGETLSDLATRCNVTEARILDLNPRIEGSKDLRPGMTLSLIASASKNANAGAREAMNSLVGRLKSYAKDADESIDEIAGSVTESVEDFIARNPDLHHRVRKIGQRLNIPGVGKMEPQISLSARRGPPGTSVTISSIGLPGNQPVQIAGGASTGGDYEILDTARTSAEGTLQVTVVVPKGADPKRDFVFVIASSNIDLALRSAKFDVLDGAEGSVTPK
ncbi:MAG: LysM domain-containing protein [Xanthobacteraceae bacterium]